VEPTRGYTRQYTWHDAKRAANLRNHGTDFAIAEEFDWATALEFEDTRHDYGEGRFVAYGKIGSRLCVMIWTPRDETVRIISLRKANVREIARYEASQS
jgi:uncharacterized DUF497 family protein